MFKNQETDKKEEADQVTLGSRGNRKEFAFYPKSNEKILTRLQRDLVPFLLLFKSGVLRYNPHQ